jgi:hypothetical protein
MSQVFEVRLIDMGPNRLHVLVPVRPLVGDSPERCRSLAEAGNLIVSRNLSRISAEGLVKELSRLGATAEVARCGCGCSDGPDHFP